MYAIEEKQRVLPDGIEITTYSREIDNANILSVEAGTTGYEGGDTGHGGRTYFKIENLGGLILECNLSGKMVGWALKYFLVVTVKWKLSLMP